MSILIGNHVVLRGYRQEDIPFFLSVRNDINLQHSLMARPKKNNESDVFRWLEKRKNEINSAFFVISDAENRAACGFIQLIKIDNDNKHAWLGLCLSEEYRGKSFAYEALSLLENHSAGTIGLKKILLEVLSNNTRAISFYHRYGFRGVGTLEQHHVVDDHFYDVVLMEKRLDSE